MPVSSCSSSSFFCPGAFCRRRPLGKGSRSRDCILSVVQLLNPLVVQFLFDFGRIFWTKVRPPSSRMSRLYQDDETSRHDTTLYISDMSSSGDGDSTLCSITTLFITLAVGAYKLRTAGSKFSCLILPTGTNHKYVTVSYCKSREQLKME